MVEYFWVTFPINTTKKGIIFMKKVCTFLIALLLILSSFAIGTEQSEAASFRTVKVVTGSSLVVKASASQNADTVATLSKGDFVTVLPTKNGWAHVQRGDVSGYAKASLLTTPSSTIKVVLPMNLISGIVVKEKATGSAKNTGTLKNKMVVQEFASSNGWSFIQYGHVTGYVASSSLIKPKTSSKYVNTASGVIVRNVASKSGANIGKIANNKKVTVYSTIAGWSYVTSGNVKGYVVDSLLRKTPSQAKTYSDNATYTLQLKTTVSVLNLREKPSTTSKVVGKLKKNQTVAMSTVFYNEGFYEVIYKGKKAYVSMDHAEKVEPNERWIGSYYNSNYSGSGASTELFVYQKTSSHIYFTSQIGFRYDPIGNLSGAEMAWKFNNYYGKAQLTSSTNASFSSNGCKATFKSVDKKILVYEESEEASCDFTGLAMYDGYGGAYQK
jgi:uncharacterized protein YgiM (DUF1202 family)